MNTKQGNNAICVLILSLFISSCRPAQLFGPIPPVSITLGGVHTCALTLGGGVKCWGANIYGGLGDGKTITGCPCNKTTPVVVIGLTSGVSAIAAGSEHTCALTSSGGVKCWGNNVNGQLGDGTTINKPPYGKATPVDVSGLTSGISAITAGKRHTCALTLVGGVKCWGDNGLGQLGNGTTTDSTIPVDVSELTSDVIAIAAGATHTCALTSVGGVKCWGDNFFGELGDNTTIGRTVPVDVSGLTSGVSAIAAGGFHTCALTSVGGVKCWGNNTYGGLGDGTDHGRAVPVDVNGLASGVSAIAVGWFHTCALTSGGGVKCWGDNGSGELGDGTGNTNTPPFGKPIPVDVSGLTSGVSAIAAGVYRTCALTSAGGVKCWGQNRYGELGDGTTTSSALPVDVRR
jgi:alpha-tubulin suppressor-like RCC1 family protein